MRRWIVIALLAAAAAGSAASAAPAPVVVKITIDQMEFAPTPAKARAGDTIEWTNKDVVAHTATSAAGGWDVTIAPGKTARVVMKKSGVFGYYCRFHPNMKGRIAVTKR
jgi:plastocyanin